MTTEVANIGVNAGVDALVALANGGTLDIYSGTRPATADTALSGNTLLASLTLGSPAFGASSAGVATANAITGDSSADNTGVASFYRVKTSGGSTVWQGDVGTSGASLNLSSVNITATGQVNVTSFTYTAPKQA